MYLNLFYKPQYFVHNVQKYTIYSIFIKNV